MITQHKCIRIVGTSSDCDDCPLKENGIVYCEEFVGILKKLYRVKRIAGLQEMDKENIINATAESVVFDFKAFIKDGGKNGSKFESMIYRRFILRRADYFKKEYRFGIKDVPRSKKQEKEDEQQKTSNDLEDINFIYPEKDNAQDDDFTKQTEISSDAEEEKIIITEYDETTDNRPDKTISTSDRIYEKQIIHLLDILYKEFIEKTLQLKKELNACKKKNEIQSIKSAIRKIETEKEAVKFFIDYYHMEKKGLHKEDDKAKSINMEPNTFIIKKRRYREVLLRLLQEKELL